MKKSRLLGAGCACLVVISHVLASSVSASELNTCDGANLNDNPLGNTINTDTNCFNEGFNEVTNSGTFYNAGQIINSYSITLTNLGRLTNGFGGTLTNSYGGALTNWGAIDNEGTLINDGWIDNNGFMENAENLDNHNTLINWGTLTNGPGGTLTNEGRIDNIGFMDNAGHLDNNDILTNRGGTYCPHLTHLSPVRES